MRAISVFALLLHAAKWNSMLFVCSKLLVGFRAGLSVLGAWLEYWPFARLF